ncbi:rubrerythrin [Candidatus Pacearchaeota archaeon CG_4_9_14_3_um_filter_31_7]|nr:MAG: rubrerythrin [Candidatus Pacearchaeota archaeon CG1_02_31_27]PIN92155.1 MAG: rubrerythrin [Candidatus Pacearchaeota archaeon CG10_big_fil_rev_8_21_14_0_10_31_59]PJA70553.1 MAG: rubrerythrin [Candidatus Pacearchaeota archaeon CG_4_9_14_3_um_filter_31_7]
MLAQTPIDLTKVDKKNLDNQIIRFGLIAELDAINLYEQMAALTKDENLKKVLLNVAKEEKEHVGEFQTLLLERDEEQAEELEEGKKEVEEITK